MKVCTSFFCCCIVLILAAQNLLYGQEKKDENQTPSVLHAYKPLTLNLDESGEKYIRFIMWHQFWLEARQNSDDQWKVTPSLRRSRFLAYAQISPRFLILTHFGINNFSAEEMDGIGQGRAQLFLHDAWVEFEAVKEKLFIGGGLHYWNGISRITSQSTLNFLPLDMPRFNWPTINTTDQFARHMGVYAKGNLGKFDYRLSVNNAMVQNVDSHREVNANFATLNTQYLYDGAKGGTVVQGYFNYQFLDQESNKLPYFVGTYLGKKQVFNVGAGFYTNPEGALILNDSADPLNDFSTEELDSKTTTQDVRLFGVDVFYDAPIGKSGAAVSAYGVYYNYNFGTNFLYGRGETVGTGDIFYTQVGYLLPSQQEEDRFQPYFTFSNRYFDQFGEENASYEKKSATSYGLGLNYFLDGHHAKLTLEFQSHQSAMDNQSSQVLRMQAAIFL
jgi:hypothetical protein